MLWQPNAQSPRFQLVRSRANDLVAAAAEYAAHGLELCGSVARGTDDDRSDIDLFVLELRSIPRFDIRTQTLSFERAIKSLLAPFSVDIRGNGSPLWLPTGSPPAGKSHYREGALLVSDIAKAAGTS